MQNRFLPDETITRYVDALFAACESLDRNDVLPRDQIQQILGVPPYVRHWTHCIVKLKRRMEDERGITLWAERGIGYRLLRQQEQLIDVPRVRVKRARGQIRRGCRSVESLPDQGLSLHQRDIKLRQIDGLRLTAERLTEEVLRQAAMYHPAEVLPRLVPA